MSDERLRELERQWRAARSPLLGRELLREYERRSLDAKLLALRVELGDLSEDDLELLAFVDAPAARAALGREPAGASGAFPRAWVGELIQRFGHAVGARAVVGAARAVEARVPLRGAAAALTSKALGRAEAWLACPCRRHEREAERFNSIRVVPAWAHEAVLATHCAGHDHEPNALAAAVEAIGEEAVRAAIGRAITTWTQTRLVAYPELEVPEVEPALLAALRTLRARLTSATAERWDVSSDLPEADVWGSPFGSVIDALGRGPEPAARRRRARLAVLAAERAVTRCWLPYAPADADAPSLTALHAWIAGEGELGPAPPPPQVRAPEDGLSLLADVAAAVRAAHLAAAPDGGLAAVEVLHRARGAYVDLGAGEEFEQWVLAEAIPAAVLARDLPPPDAPPLTLVTPRLEPLLAEVPRVGARLVRGYALLAVDLAQAPLGAALLVSPGDLRAQPGVGPRSLAALAAALRRAGLEPGPEWPATTA